MREEKTRKFVADELGLVHKQYPFFVKGGCRLCVPFPQHALFLDEPGKVIVNVRCSTAGRGLCVACFCCWFAPRGCGDHGQAAEKKEVVCTEMNFLFWLANANILSHRTTRISLARDQPCSTFLCLLLSPRRIPTENRLLWVDAVEIIWVTILSKQAAEKAAEQEAENKT